MATKDFVEGFRLATEILGQEGDWREENWSRPYEFLKAELKVHEATLTTQEKLGTDHDQIADVLAQLRCGGDENKIRADTIERIVARAGIHL